MKRCSFSAWIPILPLPIWPLAGQCSLGQNVVVGSMTLLLAVRGNIATRSMSGPSFALQLHCTTVNCGATAHGSSYRNKVFSTQISLELLTGVDAWKTLLAAWTEDDGLPCYHS